MKHAPRILLLSSFLFSALALSGEPERILRFPDSQHACEFGRLSTPQLRVFDGEGGTAALSAAPAPAPAPRVAVDVVLGRFNLDPLRNASPQGKRDRAEAMKRRWARAALDTIVDTAGSGAEKAAIYRRLAREIHQRTETMRGAYGAELLPHALTIPPWNAREIDLGGGAVLFIGKIGHAVEIRPDGSVYEVRLNLETPEGKVNPMLDSWKAPYSPNGEPLTVESSIFLERTLVEPRPAEERRRAG